MASLAWLVYAFTDAPAIGALSKARRQGAVPDSPRSRWTENDVPQQMLANSNRDELLKAADVLDELISRVPSRLDALPCDHGIYALHDHAGNIRYIGITKGDKHGFYGRISNRHVSGSEGRSHKFSHAYNTGRMWREKRDSSPDATVAKQLRTTFVRRHCRATYVIAPPALWGNLSRLELAVQALAPEGMFAWGSKRAFDPLPEPTELVDALIDDLRLSPSEHSAIERQAAASLLRRI